MDLFPRIRTISSPAHRSMFAPLAGETMVQFDHPLTDREYRKVARLVQGNSSVTLRAYGSRFTDLDFLRHFAGVRSFQVDYAYQLEDIEGLRFLAPDLERLVFGETRTPRQFSLETLRSFPRLTHLYLEKHTRDIAVVGDLSRLEELTLRSITLPDLSILQPLDRLRSLDIKLGGTKNLGLLPSIGELRYLELWQIRGLEDISMVAELTDLQYLFLQSLSRVTHLPDLSRLPRLRRVVLDTMKGITNLGPLAAAPALEQLMLIAMRQLRIEDIECLVGHPTLREATFGLGSLKRNAAAQELLDIPAVATEFEFHD